MQKDVSIWYNELIPAIVEGLWEISYTDICFADYEKTAEPKLRERGKSNEQE